MATHKKRATILVVDDTPDNLRILGELLRSDYTVKVANSGRRALDLAAQSPIPDLILLDVMMPEMDGYDCLRRLRQRPETMSIPVIFVTALDSTEDERLGLDLGAVDYITKPIRPAIVEARVRTHVEMKQARDWLLQQNSFLEAELSRFLEILAHHLQEPVRRQITYSQLLQRSLPQPLNEMAELSLEQILDGAARLRAMLTDVLAYLAVTQLSAVQHPCQVKDALDSACRDLASIMTATRATITAGEIPDLWINDRQMSEIFHALLENSLTYRRQDVPPIITISAIPHDDGSVLISVEDNGCGLDPQFHEQAFWIFERLHADHAPPNCGTGIGLALVRKIVETVNGRVWLENATGGGLIVRMILPVPTPSGARA